MIRLAIISGLLCFSSYAEDKTQGIDLKLISSVKSIAPSSTFTVGLQIHHHPGFHTYWKNPGAVGYPITINWELPEGFAAGPIRWPVPEMSDMAGSPVFGYESDVTLLVDLTAPTKLPAQYNKLHAKVSWMACSNECYPGNKTLTLDLPVGKESQTDPDAAALFAAAEQSIPKVLTGWSATLESDIDAKEISLLLTPPANLPDPGPFRFYSSDGQISSDPDPEITQLEDSRYRITAERARFSPKQSTSLPFVLVLEKPLAKDGQHFGTLDPLYPNP